MPGRTSTILYWPLSSVVALRTFSMSAGLDASTTTPGMIAPVVSLTMPAMLPVCANAVAGINATERHDRPTHTAYFAFAISPSTQDVTGSTAPSVCLAVSESRDIVEDDGTRRAFPRT